MTTLPVVFPKYSLVREKNVIVLPDRDLRICGRLLTLATLSEISVWELQFVYKLEQCDTYRLMSFIDSKRSGS